MKSLLISIIILALLPFSLAEAAVSLVQTVKGHGGGYVNSYTLSITPTAGNALVLGITMGAANTVTISDNKGNTWVSDVGATNTGNRRTELWHTYNVASGATTITVQFGASQFADSATIVREYSGLTTTNPIDKTAGAADSGATTSHTSGTTATTAQANELLVGACGIAGSTDPTWGAGTGYGNLATQNGFDSWTYGAMVDRTVSSTGTYSATCTTLSPWDGEAVIGTFKDTTPGGGGGSVPTARHDVIFFD